MNNKFLLMTVVVLLNSNVVCSMGKKVATKEATTEKGKKPAYVPSFGGIRFRTKATGQGASSGVDQDKSVSSGQEGAASSQSLAHNQGVDLAPAYLYMQRDTGIVPGNVARRKLSGECAQAEPAEKKEVVATAPTSHTASTFNSNDASSQYVLGDFAEILSGFDDALAQDRGVRQRASLGKKPVVAEVVDGVSVAVAGSGARLVFVPVVGSGASVSIVDDQMSGATSSSVKIFHVGSPTQGPNGENLSFDQQVAAYKQQIEEIGARATRLSTDFIVATDGQAVLTELTGGLDHEEFGLSPRVAIFGSDATIADFTFEQPVGHIVGSDFPEAREPLAADAITIQDFTIDAFAQSPRLAAIDSAIVASDFATGVSAESVSPNEALEAGQQTMFTADLSGLQPEGDAVMVGAMSSGSEAEIIQGDDIVESMSVPANSSTQGESSAALVPMLAPAFQANSSWWDLVDFSRKGEVLSHIRKARDSKSQEYFASVDGCHKIGRVLTEELKVALAKEEGVGRPLYDAAIRLFEHDMGIEIIKRKGATAALADIKEIMDVVTRRNIGISAVGLSALFKKIKESKDIDLGNLNRISFEIVCSAFEILTALNRSEAGRIKDLKAQQMALSQRCKKTEGYDPGNHSDDEGDNKMEWSPDEVNQALGIIGRALRFGDYEVSVIYNPSDEVVSENIVVSSPAPQTSGWGDLWEISRKGEVLYHVRNSEDLASQEYLKSLNGSNRTARVLGNDLATAVASEEVAGRPVCDAVIRSFKRNMSNEIAKRFGASLAEVKEIMDVVTEYNIAVSSAGLLAVFKEIKKYKDANLDYLDKASFAIVRSTFETLNELVRSEAKHIRDLKEQQMALSDRCKKTEGFDPHNLSDDEGDGKMEWSVEEVNRSLFITKDPLQIGDYRVGIKYNQCGLPEGGSEGKMGMSAEKK